MRELRSILRPSIEVKLIAQVVLMLLGDRDSVKHVRPLFLCLVSLLIYCNVFIYCSSGLANLSRASLIVRNFNQSATNVSFPTGSAGLTRHRQTLPDVDARRLPQRSAHEQGGCVIVRVGDERS